MKTNGKYKAIMGESPEVREMIAMVDSTRRNAFIGDLEEGLSEFDRFTPAIISPQLAEDIAREIRLEYRGVK